jgi:hypothetical protein
MKPGIHLDAGTTGSYRDPFAACFSSKENDHADYYTGR